MGYVQKRYTDGNLKNIKKCKQHSIQLQFEVNYSTNVKWTLRAQEKMT